MGAIRQEHIRKGAPVLVLAVGLVRHGLAKHQSRVATIDLHGCTRMHSAGRVDIDYHVVFVQLRLHELAFLQNGKPAASKLIHSKRLLPSRIGNLDDFPERVRIGQLTSDAVMSCRRNIFPVQIEIRRRFVWTIIPPSVRARFSFCSLFSDLPLEPRLPGCGSTSPHKPFPTSSRFTAFRSRES